uniref:Ribosomal protein S4 n=1 Tax=Ostreobium quekettii TaxID=121088 RepID=A0A650BXI1_9CHLO|nr:ribosomal protein S4 [Ostreobium quekettii]QGQ62024.1 ribosomal protein S4 [Ostreobium quekettii]
MAKKLVRKLKSCRNIRNIYENIWPTKKCSIKQQSKFKMASKPIFIKRQFHAVCLHYHFKNGLPVPKHENSRSNITNRSLAISVRPYKWLLCDPPMLACSASHSYYYKIALDIISHRFYNCTPTRLSSRYARSATPIWVTPIWRWTHSLKERPIFVPPRRSEAALSFYFFWNLLLHISFVYRTIASKNVTSGFTLMGCSSKFHASTFCSISLKSSRIEDVHGIFRIEACAERNLQFVEIFLSPQGHRRALPWNKFAQLDFSSPQYSTLADHVETLDLLSFFCSRGHRRPSPPTIYSIVTRRCGIGGQLRCNQASDLSDFQTTTFESAFARLASLYGFACSAGEMRCSRTQVPSPFDQCQSIAKPWRTIGIFETAPCSPVGPMPHLCADIAALGYLVNNTTQPFCITQLILRQRHAIIRGPSRCLSVNALALRANLQSQALFQSGQSAKRLIRVDLPNRGLIHSYSAPLALLWRQGCKALEPFAHDLYSGDVTHAFEGTSRLRQAPGCCSAGSHQSSGVGSRHYQCRIPKYTTRLLRSAAPSDPAPTAKEPPRRGGALLPLYALRRALYQTRKPKSATQLKSLFRLQLQETKKLSLLYGNLSRKQIQKICNQAFTHPLSPDAFTESVFVLLERRLDVVIFRAGFCKSIFQARQWIHHNKMNVNGRAQSAPGYLCSPGDIISCTDHSFVCKHLENFYITRTSRLADRASSPQGNADGLQWRRSLGAREPHTLPFSIRTLRMRSFAIPPLNLEVNYRNLTAVYLYSPQRIILPTFVDIYLVIRGLYR